jgi:enamine deaminase RidA (YjgF/YER057c/UK114 family)
MSNRLNIHTGAPWESIVGYCRAVRVGSHVAVTGTAAIGEDGKVVGVGDADAQTRRCLEIIERALQDAGATLADVVRTRIFVTDISLWEAVGRAHGEMFGEIFPATTMVEVSALIDPDMLVEIEADAIIADQV